MKMLLRRRLGRLMGLALLAALSIPSLASAFTFSFGDVDPGDVITSLTFNTSSTLKLSYDGVSTLTMQGYLTQIDFANKGPIGGANLPAGVVVFSSTMMLVPGTFAVAESQVNNPFSAQAGFMNGMLLDLSIFDTACVGSPVDCTLLEADWIGALDATFQEAGAVVTAELTGDLSILGGNTDFQNAFGPLGAIDSNLSSPLSDGQTTSGNLCNVVKGNALFYPNTAVPASNRACGTGGYALDDFTIAGNWTIIPVVIPEPGSALLLGLGLAGVAALKRK